MRKLNVFILSIFVIAPCLIFAQTSSPPTQKTLEPLAFPQIFSKYTGENGYEDLVIASDLILNHPLLDPNLNLEATLVEKRRILQDQIISHALQLAHDALLKPAYDPRYQSKLDETTIYPEFAGLRNLARLMGMKEYVLLADGNTSGAIEIMRDGMKISYIIQGGTLISGLVGIAIQSIAVTPIARHFGQLSVRNCDSVLGIVREARERESKLAYIMSKEKEFVLRTLSSLRDKQKLSDLLSVSYEDPLHPSPEELLEAGNNQNVFDSANKTPAALDALIDRASTLLKQECAQFEANLKLPVFRRSKITHPDSNSSPEASILGMVAPSLSKVIDSFDRQEAQLRLLAAHASIIRYQWNHSVLPDTLIELKTDRLFNLDILTDPYTGSLFIYKASRYAYDLHSVGGENGEIWLPTRPRVVQ